MTEVLGYDSYLAQGGDWGAIIADIMGVQAPSGLLGIHSNMPGILPPEIDSLFGPARADAPPSDLSEEERRTYDQVSVVYTMIHPGSDGGSGYWIPTSSWSVC